MSVKLFSGVSLLDSLLQFSCFAHGLRLVRCSWTTYVTLQSNRWERLKSGGGDGNIKIQRCVDDHVAYEMY